MTTKETLIAARNLIKNPLHWTKGDYARNAFGSYVDPTDDSAICFCAVGALGKVSGLGISVEQTESYYALQTAIDAPIISDFNDTHTHAEVLAKFDEAIAACDEVTA